MLQFYVESEVRRRQFRECPIEEHLDGFAGWLRSAGYKVRPGQLLLRGAAHLGMWTASRGVRVERISEEVLRAFARHVRRCACSHAFRGRDLYHWQGGHRFVEHLRGIGVVPPPATAVERVAPVIADFGAWMRRHRGIQTSTLGNYLSVVREFVATVGDDAATYDAARVRAYILARANRARRSGAKLAANGVRMFLRYLVVRGDCAADLPAAVPRIAKWKLATLPRYLVIDDIERLVAACEPTTAGGARDRAVILLCARLGLRAGDVRDLRLST